MHPFGEEGFVVYYGREANPPGLTSMPYKASLVVFIKTIEKSKRYELLLTFFLIACVEALSHH